MILHYNLFYKIYVTYTKKYLHIFVHFITITIHHLHYHCHWQHHPLAHPKLLFSLEVNLPNCSTSHICKLFWKEMMKYRNILSQWTWKRINMFFSTYVTWLISPIFIVVCSTGNSKQEIWSFITHFKLGK